MHKTSRKITIRDVAKSAGVSITTVSGVLNGLDEFSEATVKKVWDVAHSLNYVPNKGARNLRNDSERLKTNLIMRINYKSSCLTEDSFSAYRTHLFDTHAQKNGFFATNYHYDRLEGFRCPLLLDNLVDGVILGLPHPEVIKVIKSKLPGVLMDVSVSAEEAGMPVVKMNILDGCRRVFAKHSKRRFAILRATPEEGVYVNDDYFHIAARQAGMEYDIEFVGSCDLVMPFAPEIHSIVMAEAAEKVYQLIRRKKIDAVFVTNIVYAKGLQSYLAGKGVKMPEDFVIVSSNYRNEALPGIVSIAYDWEKLMSTSIDVLAKLINKETISCMEYLIPAKVDR